MKEINRTLDEAIIQIEEEAANYQDASNRAVAQSYKEMMQRYASESRQVVGWLRRLKSIEFPEPIVVKGRITSENLDEICESLSRGPLVLAASMEDADISVFPITCELCRFYHKEWHSDRRLKEKGYFNCWCEHENSFCGEGAFCSLAERKGADDA